MKPRGEVLLTLFLAACKVKSQTTSATEAGPIDAAPQRPRIEELAIGTGHFGCARYSNGEVACAGGNSLGQLGRGTRSGRSAGDPVAPMEPPQRIEGLRDVVRIVAGSAHACALTKDGLVHCWGSGLFPNYELATSPVRMPSIQNARKLFSGLLDVCAILEDNTVTCIVAGPIKGVADAKELAIGQRHGCALTLDQQVTCWGTMGGPEGVAQRWPILAGARELASNDYDVCAKVGERVVCAGLHFKKPSEDVAALHGLAQLTGNGATKFCGLTSENTLACWEAVGFGDAGRSLEERVKNVRTFGVAAAGHCAISNDDRIHCANLIPREVLESL